MSTSNHTSEIPYGYCHCGCGQKTRIAKHTNTGRGWVKGEPLNFINRHNLSPKEFDTVNERFWSKVAFTANPDKCWNWLGGGSAKNYGKFDVDGKSIKAHRFAYELTYGEIVNGLWVLHKCDNRLCVNPNHLFLGTHQDNMQDMIKKGRHNILSPNRFTKLSAEDVLYIRRQYENGAISKGGLSREMGVHLSTITAIVKRKTWRHLKP